LHYLICSVSPELLTFLFDIVVWEGPEALEECFDAKAGPAKVAKKKSVEPRPKRTTPVHLPSDSEEDPSSADEYIVEDIKSKGKNGKVRLKHGLIFAQKLTCSLFSVRRVVSQSHQNPNPLFPTMTPVILAEFAQKSLRLLLQSTA
jgi:hypothetical protein